MFRVGCRMSCGEQDCEGCWFNDAPDFREGDTFDVAYWNLKRRRVKAYFKNRRNKHIAVGLGYWPIEEIFVINWHPVILNNIDKSNEHKRVGMEEVRF